MKPVCKPEARWHTWRQDGRRGHPPVAGFGHWVKRQIHRAWRRLAKRALLSLLLSSPALAADRWQERFVADKWSPVHVAGGSACYLLPRLSGAPPAEALAISFSAALAWEIWDAEKASYPAHGDWRDVVLTSDGFSWSDLVYHMAGTYCTWLVWETTGGRVVFVPLVRP